MRADSDLRLSPHRRSPHRRRRHDWPAWAYYALAGVLVLITIPMYRVILAPRSVADDAPAAPVAPVRPVAVERVPDVVRAEPVPQVDLSRFLLADDQRCVGGSVVQVHGTTYTQVGAVRCSGRVADSPLR